MKIKFLGTAAAEGVPAVFCNCELCRTAKEKGGPNIRTRSQLLVGDSVLFDFPPDTYFHMVQNKLDLSAVENLFITHSHMDHFYPQELTRHGAPFAHNMTAGILNVYGNDTVIKLAKKEMRYDLKKEAAQTLRLNAVKPYDKILLKNLTVTALPARHTKGENCFIYLVSDGVSSFLQFNDSGILDDEVYEYLKNTGAKLGLVIFDCTYGYFRKGPGRHMGILDNVDERERMKAYGIVSNQTKYILTHFSHNSGLTHEQTVEKVKDMDFTVAYDGMETEI